VVRANEPRAEGDLFVRGEKVVLRSSHFLPEENNFWLAQRGKPSGKKNFFNRKAVLGVFDIRSGKWTGLIP